MTALAIKITIYPRYDIYATIIFYVVFKGLVSTELWYQKSFSVSTKLINYFVTKIYKF